MVPSLTGSLFLQWLHDLFPHHQMSSSIAAQRFPHISRPHIKGHCLHPPPMASVFSPFFIFSQSASPRGVAGSHSLLGDEGLQESESCAVCCCTPGLGEGPAFGRCCTVFVRIMAGLFHFSGVDKQEYF